jgi:hypothetical protein
MVLNLLGYTGVLMKKLSSPLSSLALHLYNSVFETAGGSGQPLDMGLPWNWVSRKQ